MTRHRQNQSPPRRDYLPCAPDAALLDGIGRLGFAVSGGADSVALLRLLLPLCRARGIEPVVLHLDHGLRGAASRADARFVAQVARRLVVPARLATASIATRDGVSLEMAARAARQSFFRLMAREERLDAIATGHTADDVAETLLLRLARGSGAAGLSGLRPRTTVAGVVYLRPLLGLSHASLCAWLRRIRQSWREDATNRDRSIPRNRVRHVVLPWMERHWQPAIRSRLAQSAAILRDEDAWLEEMTHRALRRVAGPSLDLRRLAALPRALQRRVVRLWLLNAGHAEASGWAEVERLLAQAADRPAWQVSLPGGLLARAARGRLIVAAAAPAPSRAPDEMLTLPVPGTVTVAGTRVTARRSRGVVRTEGPVGRLPSTGTLDAETLRGRTLAVRTRRPGDRIQPLGMAGSKSIQDLLVDAKVPAAQRDRLPLLVVDSEVAWVPGYRVASCFAVRAPGAPSIRITMKPAVPRRPLQVLSCAR